MSTSVLRTADAWYVHTPAGAARIDTGATTTAGLLADRDAITRAAAGTDTIAVESLSLVSACPCRDGCPSCVGPVGEVGSRGKEVALAILRAVLGPSA